MSLKNLVNIMTCLVIISPVYLVAQISIGGDPLSFSRSDIPNDERSQVISLSAPDFSVINLEDSRREQEGLIPLYSRFIERLIDIKKETDPMILSDGSRIWKLKIKAEGAKAIHLLYDSFYLPPGARLYLYNASRTHKLGAFTHLNNKIGGKFATSLVAGDETILEYYEPLDISDKEGVIKISKIGYAYRHVEALETKLQRNDNCITDCMVDVTCSEGDNWRNQQKGAVRISVVDASGAGWCSGSLVNNTNQDCKPYVLSAWHCSVAAGQLYDQYIFYFNNEKPCGGACNLALENESVTGCTMQANSNDGGGNTGSDFVLYELSIPVPAVYSAHYAGWNANNVASPSGVSIHHPGGRPKKISTYSNPLVSSSAGGVVLNTHWEVSWVATANGHSLTAGGSLVLRIANKYSI